MRINAGLWLLLCACPAVPGSLWRCFAAVVLVLQRLCAERAGPGPSDGSNASLIRMTTCAAAGMETHGLQSCWIIAVPRGLLAGASSSTAACRLPVGRGHDSIADVCSSDGMTESPSQVLVESVDVTVQFSVTL